MNSQLCFIYRKWSSRDKPASLVWTGRGRSRLAQWFSAVGVYELVAHESGTVSGLWCPKKKNSVITTEFDTHDLANLSFPYLRTWGPPPSPPRARASVSHLPPVRKNGSIDFRLNRRTVVYEYGAGPPEKA